MPRYSIQGPDGNTYSIDGPEGATREEVITAIKSQLGAKPTESEQAGFFQSVGEAAATLGAAPAAAKFAAAQTPEEKAAAREALLAKTQSKYARTAAADIEDIPSAIDWFKQTTGSSIGSLVAPAAAALVTSPVGGLGTLGAQYTTSNLIRQAEEQEAALAKGETPEETSVTKAALAAAGSTALDRLGFKFFAPIMTKFPLVRNLIGANGDKAAKETGQALVDAVRSGKYSIKGGIFKGMVGGTAVEVPQEIAQSALERWQAGASLTGSDAYREYMEAGAGAVLLGSTLGAGKGYVQNKRKIDEAKDVLQAAKDSKIAEQNAAKEAQEAADKAEREKAKEEKKAGKEDAVAVAQMELDDASEILRNIGPEKTENEYRDELRKQKGLNIVEADKLLRRLASNKILGRKDPETGLYPLLEKQVDVASFAEELSKTGEAVPAATPAKTEAEPEIPFGATVPTGAESAAAVGAAKKAKEEAAAQEAAAKESDFITKMQLAREAKAAAKKAKEEAAAKKATEEAAAQEAAAQEAAAQEAAAQEAAAQEAAAQEAAAQEAAAKGEQYVPPSTDITGPVAGTSAGRVKNAVQVDTAGGPQAARTESDGLDGAVPVSGDSNVGAENSEAALAAAAAQEAAAQEAASKKAEEEVADKETKQETVSRNLEAWEQRLAKSKSDDPTSLRGIFNRINSLKEALSGNEGQVEEGNVYDALSTALKANLDKPVNADAFVEQTSIPRRISEEDMRDALNDLISEGIVSKNESGEIVLKKNKQNSLKEFVAARNSNLQNVSGLLSEVIDKFNTPKVDNSATFRESTSKKLDEIEAKLQDEIDSAYFRSMQRVALRKKRDISVVGAQADEGGRYDIAQEEIGAKSWERFESINPAVTEMVSETAGTMDDVLKAIDIKVSQTIDSAKGAESLRDEKDLTGAEDIDSLLDAAAQSKKRISDSQLNKAKFVKQLVNSLRRLSPKNVNIQVEGVTGSNPEIFARLKASGNLAIYDPKTRTIYVTKKGNTTKTLLHEFVHAATVETLRKFETDPESLTEAQREAVEHLNKVYVLAKKRIGSQYTAPFENLYEFISYAMTEPDFQRSLANLRTPKELTKYSRRWFESISNYFKEGLAGTLWDQLTYSVMRMFGLNSSVSSLYRTMTPRKGASGKQYSVNAAGKSASKIRKERIAAKKGVESTLEEDEKSLPENFVETEVEPAEESNLYIPYEAGNVYENLKLSSPEATNKLNNIRKDPVGNLLIEVIAATQDILAAPVEVEGVAPLPARRSKGKRYTVAPDPKRTLKDLVRDNLTFEEERIAREKAIKGKQTFLWGRPAYESLVDSLQNDRRRILTQEEQLRMAKKLSYTGDDQNALNTSITESSGKAHHNVMAPQPGMKTSLKQDMDTINGAVSAYAKIRGLTADEALAELNMLMVGLHEKERRFVKFLFNVPLSNDAANKITVGKITDTPANIRDGILKTLYSNTEKTADGKSKLIENGAVKNMRAVLEALAGYKNGVKVSNGHIDTVNGVRTNDTEPTAASGDLNSDEYVVVGGLSSENIDTLRKDFAELTQKGAPTAEVLNTFMSAFERYQNTTKALDRSANYWSVPVDNLSALYGFKNYVPLKGRGGAEISKGDDRFEVGKRFGGEYTESTNAFGGRETPADNVVSQTLIDGTRAAMRDGRKDVSKSFVNLIKQKVISGKLVKKIPFSDRYKNIVNPQDEKGDDKFYNYLDDGSIEIWRVGNKDIFNAVRREYKNSNPLVEFGNRVTGFIGHSHTRYNPAFYPYNFVRDTLTNAFYIGIDTDTKTALKYVGAVASNIPSFSRAFRVSKLYAEGNVTAIKNMAKKHPEINTLLEFLEEGGRVSYVQGLALEGQMESLQKQIGKNKFAPNVEAAQKWIDAWADMFEFTSRAAAYRIMKSDLTSKGMSEADAKKSAAAYTKNLANFEQVGTWGRELGAFFMFFRPAATGAVRAIDALTPLLEDVSNAEKRLPSVIRDDVNALNNFRKEHARQKAAATTLLMSVAGAGATIYMMAMMGSDDDEFGRNRVKMDDASLWTRNIRLPLGMFGGEGYLQIPWGFGIGAFAAAGAQIAAVSTGPTTITDLIANTTTIALDSYIPVPVSRVSPLENPGVWLMDSLMPSFARPLAEFLWNVDGLGRQIYNDRVNKYGESYTSNKNVPQLYKDASDLLFKISNGETEVSPNSLHFFANNYVDGAFRIFSNAWGLGYTLSGTKDFDAKTDVSLISSFIGRNSNYDAKEYARVSKAIEKHNSVFNSFINQKNAEGLRRYIERYPNAYMMTKIYAKVENSALKDVREALNIVKNDKSYTLKEKSELIKQIELQQNLIKQKMVLAAKDYKIL